MGPRVREFVPAVTYLLSLVLLGATAYQYVSTGARSSRARAAIVPTATPVAATTLSGARVLLNRAEFVVGTPDSLEVEVVDAAGRPLTPDEFRGGSVKFALVRADLAEIRPLTAQPDGAGCWDLPVSLAEVGAYRLITQLRLDARAEPLVIGTDLRALEPIAG